MGKSYVICPNCGIKQEHYTKNCKKCGASIYGTDEEYEKLLEMKHNIEKYNKNNESSNHIVVREKNKKPMFTDEQILVTGLYPQNSFFKGLLISRILGRK